MILHLMLAADANNKGKAEIDEVMISTNYWLK